MNRGLTLGLTLGALSLLLLTQRRDTWQPPETAAPYLPLIRESEAKYGLPVNLLARLLYQESRYREDIITGRYRSGAGAVGIAQIVPKWHPEVGEAGALDPARAIPYAAKYLRQNFDRFGSWALALAAYNWGPTALANALRANTPVTHWPEETQNYMADITTDAGLV